MHGLGVYVRECLPVNKDCGLEVSAEPFICFRVLPSISYLFFLYWPPSQSSSAINIQCQ